MSIYKRGDVYWYKFMWQGRLVRESTKQGNDKTARKMEAAHRTRLAEGPVGIREKKRTTWASSSRTDSSPGRKAALRAMLLRRGKLGMNQAFAPCRHIRHCV